MNIYVLTIHNPKYSLGPHMRLKCFLDSANQSLSQSGLTFTTPHFSEKTSKFHTLGILFQSFFHIIKNHKKIDLIHVVVPPSYSALTAVLAKKIFKIPYVIDIGDPTAENMKILKNWPENSRKFRLLKHIDNLLYKNAKHLILTSPLLTKYIPENIPNTTIITAVENQNNITARQIHSNKKCVYFGNFGPLQNLEYLIKIFTKAIDRDPAISLDIISSGKMEGITSPNITFKPQIPPEQIKEVSGQYDCGIISINLGKNLDYAITTKLLTYLSYGLPVFGTASESSKKIVESSSSGYIATDYNEGRDTEKLLKFLSDKESLQIYSDNATKYAKENLSRETCSERIKSLYSIILK